MLDPPISEECELRPLEESDAAELYAVVDANRAYLAPWLPWAQGQTPENTVEFLRVARKQRADGEAVQSAILREGRIVGVIGNHAIDPAHRSTELGYWLAEDAQGGGTMTAAVRAYTDHAFSAWGLNRVQIRVGVENAPAAGSPSGWAFVRRGSCGRPSGSATATWTSSCARCSHLIGNDSAGMPASRK